MSRTLLVMAGGTGGHVFPAWRWPTCSRAATGMWSGWARRMAWKRSSFPRMATKWPGFVLPRLRGKGLLRKLLLPFHLFAACWQARREIRRVRPDVVLGMGGYVSFPGGLMAALLGRPLIIHEQNSIAGLANRVLARFAKRVACGFPNALPSGVWVGNPLRPEMNHLPAPAQRFAGREAPVHLLVLGGSQGAVALNEIVPQGLALIDAEQRPLVVHQAGEKHLAQLQEELCSRCGAGALRRFHRRHGWRLRVG
jgi:UDP-N-acetylglucosamine--N-acetylmuramyl-(pentapeptide) pyrophosphoryl-undecaprenol N-acetylglucosamine transferase